ncbi:hypothetical protein HZC32_02280 [Candidatus Woesearchaeota archaeon]|nr:hypothetical protein [Candidatus Woesearchaeota archaeon]
MTKAITSVKEFQRFYFPDALLDRLEETLCSKLNLTENHQRRLAKNEENPKTGFIEVAKNSDLWPNLGSIKSISEIVTSFYKEEGYYANPADNSSITIYARKSDKHYWIGIIESESSYLISIMNVPTYPLE